MCEIPSNVILADDWVEVFDGFSIGSNDLPQLVLGEDRDLEIETHLFDERDPVVRAVSAHVSCGQAPSDSPECARFLVEQGSDSIALNTDALRKATLAILELEQAQTPGTPAAHGRNRARGEAVAAR